MINYNIIRFINRFAYLIYAYLIMNLVALFFKKVFVDMTM